MNNVGSELEWLYYHLWIKIGAAPPRFTFSIPETVFYRHNRADSWYFTSKEGHILKKNKFNVNQKVIHQKFTKRLTNQDLVAATAYYYRKDTPYMDLFMEHVSVQDFRTYMFFSNGENVEKPQALQKYQGCKQAKNTILRCHWSPQFSVVEKQVNNHNLFDTKIPLSERIPTFEGAVHQSKAENIVTTTQIDEVNECIRQIQDHLLSNSHLQLLGGRFYFKVDRADNLVLLFATNIKIDKIDVHTLDNVEIRLKLWASQEVQEVQQVRPASHKAHPRLRQVECPFFETQIQANDGYDITYSQIIKIYNYYEDNSDLLLESNPENFYFNQQLYLAVQSSIGSIPQPIKKVFPNMSMEKYLSKKQDPLFLYENVKVCNDCYKSVKLLVAQVSQEEKPVQIQYNKNIQFQQNLLSQTESIQSEQPFLHKMKKNLNNTDLKRVYTRPQTGKFQRTGSAKGSLSDRLNFHSARDSDTTVQSTLQQPMMMMFSKVEAGKEVAQMTKIDDRVEIKETFDDFDESKINISRSEQKVVKDVKEQRTQKQFKVFNIQQKKPLQKESQKKLVPKVDWEKEYQQSVKDKTKQVTTHILDTCDQIENGKYKVSQALSDSLDLKMQKEEAASKSRSRMHQANTYNDSGFASVSFDIEREYIQQQQISNMIMLQQNQEKEYVQHQRTTSKDRPLDHIKSFSKIMGSSDQKSFKSMKENVQQNLKAKIPLPKKVRPMSSKPQVVTSNQFNLEIDWDARRATQVQTTQQNSTKANKLQNSNSQTRHKSKLPPKSAAKKPPTAGLLDFQNMTSDHIKQIAENADQLISIIKNIKDQAKPVARAPEINEPCIEDENEEDCTYEVIDTGRLKSEGNSWW